MFSRTKPSQHLKLRQTLHDKAMRLALFLFVIALSAQVAFWSHTREIKPEMGIVPAVPGERTVHALSFGDEEVFFRLLALNIQNSGDTFGRFTALYKYDYNRLYHWFRLLDKLNNQSNYLPSMAAYYFSQSQNPDHVRYLIDYLDEYTLNREKEKWWWVVQATYMASHKLQNTDRALELASRLRDVRGIPIWAQQLPAFIHESRGEFEQAKDIIESIMKNPEQYSESELNFMVYFVKERIRRFDEVKEEYEKAKKAKEEMRAKGIPDVAPMGPPKDVGAPEGPAVPLPR